MYNWIVCVAENDSQGYMNGSYAQLGGVCDRMNVYLSAICVVGKSREGCMTACYVFGWGV